MALKMSAGRRNAAWTDDPVFAEILASGKSLSVWINAPSTANAWGVPLLAWYELGYPFAADANHRAFIRMELITNAAAGSWGLHIVARDQDNGVISNNNPGAAVSQNEWHHFAFVFPSGGGYNLIVDGTQRITGGTMPDVDTGVLFLSSTASFVPLTGRDAVAPNHGASAKFADVCVLDAELTAGEAATIYSSGSPTYDRTGTTLAGKTVLGRMPLIDDGVDIIGADAILASQHSLRFEDDSDLFGSYSGEIIADTNKGVATSRLAGNRPATLIFLSDSFGSYSPIRVFGPTYDKLNYGRPMGRVVADFFTHTESGFTGNSQDVGTGNDFVVENQTTRTISSSTWADGVCTATYDGPNLVVGQKVKINSVYYILTAFTAGAGVGDAQTGATITFNVDSDPGSLAGQTISVIFTVPMQEDTDPIPEQYNQTGTRYSRATIKPVVNFASGHHWSHGGCLDRLDHEWDGPQYIRIYHRVASDVSQQVKAVKVKTIDSENAETVITVSNLDNPQHAGTIQLLAEVDVTHSWQRTAGSDQLHFLRGFDVVPTDDPNDAANRYLFLTGLEYKQSDDSMPAMRLGAASWSYAGYGHTQDSDKSMCQHDIDTFVKTVVPADREAVIVMLGDQEVRTREVWQELAESTKTAWDLAFRRAGKLPPRYLLPGLYMHARNAATGSVRLAEWRNDFANQNIGFMRAALANPTTVEFVSLYEMSDGIWELPVSGDDGVISPGATPATGSLQAWYDPRIRTHKLAISDATWDNGTLTLTKSGGFDEVLVIPGSSWVYVKQTALAGTPVVEGWYQITGATANTLTVSETITSGAAGVGSDVEIAAIATIGQGLHPTAGSATYFADLIATAVRQSPTTYDPLLIADLSKLLRVSVENWKEKFAL